MKIATWNVNSIRARLDRLLAWLSSASPDVVCLQELKCEASQFPEEAIRAAGYQAAVFGQRTYNGVAILSRTDLTDVCRGMEDGVEDPQARLVGATVGGIRIYSVYVPNGQAVGSPAYAYKLDWYRRLRAFLDRRHTKADPVIVCGDFNVAPEPIDVHDPAAWEGQTLFSIPEREALKALCEFGLVDVYRARHPEPDRYTWWDYRMLAFPKNHGLRIDHLLCTKSVADRVAEAEIERDQRKGKQPSDHVPVWLALGPAA